MPELNTRQRRRRLDFAALVKTLATGAPDEQIRAEMLRVVKFIERRCGFTDKEKADIVYAGICEGMTTIKEIHEHTGLRPQEVADLVAALKVNGLVRVQMSRPVSRTGAGRPVQQIFPV